MPAKDIQCEVVKVLEEQEAGMGSNHLRIVKWIVDGKDTGALLEKRNVYTTKDGQDRMGKAKGMNLADLNVIVKRWDEIKSLMQE